LASRDLALLAKRDGDFTCSAALWEQLAADPNDGIHACEQLAIHYEHRARDLPRALEYAQLALAKLRRLRRLPSSPLSAARAARLEAQLARRLARLERRLGIRKPALQKRLIDPLPSSRSGHRQQHSS
jgi:hypothetical protein